MIAFMHENKTGDLKPYAISRPLLQRISWGLVVFTVGWIGFVVVFDWQLLPVLSQEIRSLIFKPVDARLVSCEIVAETDPNAGWKSFRVIKYDYVVENKTYQSNRFYPTRRLNERGDRADPRCEKFQVGQAVTAYTNPYAPEEAILRRGLQPSTTMILMFLTPFNLVGLAMLRWGYRTMVGLRKGELMREVFLQRDHHNGWRLTMIEASSLELGGLALGVSTAISLFIALFFMKSSTPVPVEGLLWLACIAITLATVLVCRRRARAGRDSWVFNRQTCTLVRGDGTVRVRCADIVEIEYLETSRSGGDSDIIFGFDLLLRMNDKTAINFHHEAEQLVRERARVDGEFLKDWLTKELALCRLREEFN
jgi:Protein of unknown function (DUF3592)